MSAEIPQFARPEIGRQGGRCLMGLGLAAHSRTPAEITSDSGAGRRWPGIVIACHMIRNEGDNDEKTSGFVD
jgi:hypothetical protein